MAIINLYHASLKYPLKCDSECTIQYISQLSIMIKPSFHFLDALPGLMYLSAASEFTYIENIVL